MLKSFMLYVEDDELSREIMELCVDDLPEYDLSIFSDSANFMDRVAALPGVPAIILLDIHIQPYNGFQMLEMLRATEAYKQLPIIAVTASVMNEEINKLKQVGFNGAIAKPIDQDHFAQYINELRMGRQVWSIIDFVE